MAGERIGFRPVVSQNIVLSALPAFHCQPVLERLIRMATTNWRFRRHARHSKKQPVAGHRPAVCTLPSACLTAKQVRRAVVFTLCARSSRPIATSALPVSQALREATVVAKYFKSGKKQKNWRKKSVKRGLVTGVLHDEPDSRIGTCILLFHSVQVISIAKVETEIT